MTEVQFEELWEPWYVGERPYESARMDIWNIPPDLVARFNAAKHEMEEVWQLLRQCNPEWH